LSIFSNLFGGRSKAVQVEKTILPSIGGYEQYEPLRDFAFKRMSGETAGFGDDFVNQATNPQAKRMREDFLNYTDPYITSKASAMGMGRSNLTLNKKAQAFSENESDIQQLMSKFLVLNEAQKKTDQAQGAQISESLLDKQANRASQQAGIDVGINTTNAGLKANADTAQREGINKLIATALGGVAGMAGGGATSALSGATTSFSGNPQANIAGIPSSSLSGMSVEQLLALIGGR